MFGKEFKVLKNLPIIYEKVGDNYPEYFCGYEEDEKLEYCILDDNFCQPSPANDNDGAYAKKLRKRSSKILSDLIEEGYIELFNCD